MTNVKTLRRGANRAGKGLLYSLYLIVHPFDGFYDLKHEKRGNTVSATAILALTVVTWLIRRQYTGFLFNFARPRELNILAEMLTVLLPFTLWCVSNWCLTTLTNGEGSLRDIYVYSCYSLTPIVLLFLPMVLYSNVATFESAAFYNFFINLAFVWAGFLFFCGTLVTHQFTAGKTVASVLIIIVGMGVLVFLGLLLINLLQVMANFLKEVYLEYRLRI